MMSTQLDSYLPRSSIRMTWGESKSAGEVNDPAISPLLALVYSNMGFQSFVKQSDIQISPNIFEDFPPHTFRIIGRGASFIVTHGIVKMMHWGQPVEQVVALKRPRNTDMPDDHPGWRSLLFEFRTLAFNPMRHHDNIVKLIGLVWDGIIPVMVLEYAKYGTLAMLERHSLRDKTKFRLCHDVARGLHFLHTCFIIHGDVKSENVLIFSHPDRRFVAKLGDFGGSVLDIEDESVLLSGTQPWNAPEWRERIKNDRLPKTDIYSFGLLFLRTILGGDPFSRKHLFDLPSDPAARLAEIQNLKQQDEILPRSLRVIKQGHPASTPIWGILCSSLLKDPASRSLECVLIGFGQLEQIEDTYDTTKNGHDAVEVMQAKHDKLVRDMKALLSQRAASYRTNLFPRSVLEMDTFVQLPSYLKRLLIEDLNRSVTSPEFSPAGCYLQLSLITLSTSQSPEDDSRAFAYLLSSIQHGNEQAEGFLYRFSTVLEQKIPDTINISSTLKRHMLRGSLLAYQDLQSLDPALHRQVLVESRCLQVYSHPKSSVFETTEAAQSYLSISNLTTKVSSLKVHIDKFFTSPRKDGGQHVYRLLHLAAEHGFIDSVQYLLDQGASIDLRNANGDTALLLACQSGHAKVALKLIEHGASVGIPNNVGETPIHWLCKFDVQDVPELAAALMRSGADIESRALASEHHDLFNGSPGGGIPLKYAVQYNNNAAVTELLKIAEQTRPSLERDKHAFDSLVLACRCRAATIVAIILDYITKTEREGMAVIVNQLLRHIISSGGRLHEVIFGGPNHVQSFATLQVLHSHCLIFTETIDDTIESALALAVTFDRCAFVDYFLRAEPEFSIDSPCCLDGKTALQLAVKSGSLATFNLLVDRGADINRHWKNCSTLHLCGLANSDVALDIAKRLLSMGVPVESTDTLYQTPFQLAVLHKSFRLAEEFLLHNANANATFLRSYPSYKMDEPTTLLGAFFLRNIESDLPSMKFLLGKLDPHCEHAIMVSPSRQRTVFHVASALDSILTIDHETLSRMSAMVFEWWKVDDQTKSDILSRLDDMGYSALHLAAICGNIILVDLLLSNGANPLQRSKSGCTARFIAQHQKTSMEQLPNTHAIIEQRSLFDKIIHLLDNHQMENDVDEISVEDIRLEDLSFPTIDTAPWESLFVEPFEDSRRIVLSQREISEVHIILCRTPLPPRCIPIILELADFTVQTLTVREQCVAVSTAVSEEPEQQYLLSEPLCGFTSPPLVSVTFRMECRHEDTTIGGLQRVTGTSKESKSWFGASVIREGKEVTDRYVVAFKPPGITSDLVVMWTDHPILTAARNGDQIALWVVASLPEWENHICAGKILTHTTPYCDY